MRAVGIVGIGETPYRMRRADVNYVELVQSAVLEALKMAEMTADDIDAVVYAMAPTEFAGMTDIDKWVVGAIGAADKPFMRVHLGGATGGAAALAGESRTLGCLRQGAGGRRRQGRRNPDAQKILNLIWDPFYERGFGSTRSPWRRFRRVATCTATGPRSISSTRRRSGPGGGPSAIRTPTSRASSTRTRWAARP